MRGTCKTKASGILFTLTVALVLAGTCYGAETHIFFGDRTLPGELLQGGELPVQVGEGFVVAGDMHDLTSVRLSGDEVIIYTGGRGFVALSEGKGFQIGGGTGTITIDYPAAVGTVEVVYIDRTTYIWPTDGCNVKATASSGPIRLHTLDATMDCRPNLCGKLVRQLFRPFVSGSLAGQETKIKLSASGYDEFRIFRVSLYTTYDISWDTTFLDGAKGGKSTVKERDIDDELGLFEKWVEEPLREHQRGLAQRRKGAASPSARGSSSGTGDGRARARGHSNDGPGDGTAASSGDPGGGTAADCFVEKVLVSGLTAFERDSDLDRPGGYRTLREPRVSLVDTKPGNTIEVSLWPMADRVSGDDYYTECEVYYNGKVYDPKVSGLKILWRVPSWDEYAEGIAKFFITTTYKGRESSTCCYNHFVFLKPSYYVLAIPAWLRGEDPFGPSCEFDAREFDRLLRRNWPISYDSSKSPTGQWIADNWTVKCDPKPGSDAGTGGCGEYSFFPTDFPQLAEVPLDQMMVEDRVYVPDDLLASFVGAGMDHVSEKLPYGATVEKLVLTLGDKRVTLSEIAPPDFDPGWPNPYPFQGPSLLLEGRGGSGRSFVPLVIAEFFRVSVEWDVENRVAWLRRPRTGAPPEETGKPHEEAPEEPRREEGREPAEAGESNTQTVKVYARRSRWQRTGVYLKEGDKLRITARGRVVHWKSRDKTQSRSCGPEGVNDVGVGPEYLCPRCCPLGLVGKFGGECFGVGEELSAVVRGSGELLLGMNDTSPGGWADNEGYWTVEIEVLRAASEGEGGSGAPAPPASGGMVLIPAGTFTMGSDPGEGETDEMPEHHPYISGFYMDLYEVTNARYADALNWAVANGRAYWDGSDVVKSSSDQTGYLSTSGYLCRIDHSGSVFVVESGYEEHPVVQVTWYGAAAYCNWRSEREGLTPCYDTGTWGCNFSASGYRLPTEAEWEKGARGSLDERTYPWGEEAPDCGRVNASIGGYCVGDTSPVGSYPTGRSPYGLYDMAGNVWEWCSDWYDSGYYATSPLTDPRGPSNGASRVLRGGSRDDVEGNIRCALRVSNNPTIPVSSGGFRCARSQ